MRIIKIHSKFNKNPKHLLRAMGNGALRIVRVAAAHYASKYVMFAQTYN